MKRNISVIVETGKNLFSCFMTGAEDLPFNVVGDGKTAKKAIEDFKAAYKDMKGFLEGRGEEVPELEFKFVFDVGAFLNYYPINVTAFAEYVGLNPSLIRQYACGLRQPKEKALQKIRQGLDAIAHDIADGLLIDRPVPQYT